MAFTPDQTNAIAAAYQAGNIGEVNNLLASANMTADQANSIWGSGISDLATQAGVQFAPAPTGGLPTTAAPTTVDQLYTSILGRQGETEGLDYWRSQFGDSVDDNELATFRAAAAPELANTGYGALPTTTTPAPTPTPAPDYSQLVTDAYGTIGRTGIGTDVSNIDQGGFDEWKRQLANGTIKPEDFNSVFSNAVRSYTTANPDDPYTKYVNNYQLGQQTDPMKTGLNSIFADNKVSWEEAQQINEYYNQFGFKPEDIARVTGVSLDKVNEAIGARGGYISSTIAANLNNPAGLAEYAIDNKLSAKDLVASSGGVLTQETAQALLDKGSTYAGRVELASPEAYNQINGIIDRAVNKDYGGKPADWMYRMFTGLSANELSQAPKQLEVIPAHTETRKNPEGEDYTVQIPASLKDSTGLIVLETDEEGNPTKYGKEIDSKDFNVKPGERTHTGARGLIAEYDANGNQTGFSSGNRIYVSDPSYYTASWDATGKARPSMATTDRNSWQGFIDDTIGGVKDMVGPELWTLAKFTPAAPYVYAADAIDSASHGKWGQAAVSALGSYGAAESGNAASMQDPSSVNAVNGADLASDVKTLGYNPAIQATTNAQYARLGAAGITAGMALENGNYTPLLALGANIAGVNGMPVVANSMNVLTAANAIKTGDSASLLTAAGNLTNSPDLKLAGAANRFINAANSGDRAALAVATMSFASTINSNTSTAATTLKDAVFGPAKIDTSSLKQGSTITPEGPAKNISDAGTMDDITLAAAGNGTVSDAGNGLGGTSTTAPQVRGLTLQEGSKVTKNSDGSYSVEWTNPNNPDDKRGYELSFDAEGNASYGMSNLSQEEGGTGSNQMLITTKMPVFDPNAETTEGAGLGSPDKVKPVSEVENEDKTFTQTMSDGSTRIVDVNGKVVSPAFNADVDTSSIVGNTGGSNSSNTAGVGGVNVGGSGTGTGTGSGNGNGNGNGDGNGDGDGGGGGGDGNGTTVVTPTVVVPPVVTPPSGGTSTPTTTKTSSLGGSTATPSNAPSFLPPEPGKFKKISEDFTPLNPLLFALAGVGPLKGTLEEQLNDKEETKKKMPSLADILFSPTPTQEQPPASYTPVARNDGDGSTPAPDSTEQPEQIIPAYAQGGLTGMHPMGEPEFFSQGGLGNMHVQGQGDGTSDSVPAMVAKDEFVLPADVVSSLGNGSSEAGASVLDQFVEVIRQHKHSNPPSELPPQSKGPLEYLSSAMKKGHA